MIAELPAYVSLDEAHAAAGSVERAVLMRALRRKKALKKIGREVHVSTRALERADPDLHAALTRRALRRELAADHAKS